MDKRLLNLIPVNENAELNTMLIQHHKITGLDYADTPDIINHTFNTQIKSDQALEVAEWLISRLNLYENLVID